jgi:hypothetical protein
MGGIKMTAKVLLVFAGVVVGAAGAFFYPGLTGAEAGRRAAVYQIQPAQGASAVVWRLNALTGHLELCYASNYKNWIEIPGQDLVGRCSAMPTP